MNGILKYSIVALIGFSTVARADLEFDWSGSAFFSERQKVGGMWQITVRTVGSPAMTLRIEADGTEEKIRYIRVQAEAPTPGQCQLIVQGINGGKVVRVEEISWIPASSNKADLWINVLDIDKDSLGGEGGLGTGSGGSVEAHVIGAVNVEGDVTADLATLPNPVAGYSRINNVAVEGDLLGNVASQEEIISLEVTGDIGSSTNTVSISAGDHVDSIVAANIWADIEIGESIHVLRTPGTAGDFNGSLETGDVGGAISPIGIQISRDINADLTISGDITKPIKAGRSLNGDISIAGDLLDQVFINWYTGGSWSGDVTVGSTTLSPKGAYTQTGLGGGAVGLAPFDLHKQDCDPPYSGSTWPTTSSATLDIDLVHYGPIKHDGSGAPFLVFRYPGAHCDLQGCEGGVNDMANWSLSSISGRTMTLSATLDEDYHYHVNPVRTGTNMLKCDGLASSAGDVPVKDYTYVIYREP